MKKKLLLGAGTVVIIVIVVAAVFILKHHQTNNSHNLSTANAKTAPAKAGAPYNLSDLGVRLPNLPQALAGMTITVQKSPPNVKPPVNIVQLHLQSYSDLANKCLGTPLSTTQNFASLSTAPTLNGALPPGASAVKQFKNFYVTNLGASIPANIKCQDQQVQTDLNNLSDQLNKALTQAFANAQQT